MPPKLRSDDGRNIVIRPLAYSREQDLIAFAEAKQMLGEAVTMSSPTI